VYGRAVNTLICLLSYWIVIVKVGYADWRVTSDVVSDVRNSNLLREPGDQLFVGLLWQWESYSVPVKPQLQNCEYCLLWRETHCSDGVLGYLYYNTDLNLNSRLSKPQLTAEIMLTHCTCMCSSTGSNNVLLGLNLSKQAFYYEIIAMYDNMLQCCTNWTDVPKKWKVVFDYVTSWRVSPQHHPKISRRRACKRHIIFCDVCCLRGTYWMR